MTKAEIVNEISRTAGIEKSVVQTVLEEFMESVRRSVIDGEPVFLRGFGSFVVKQRAEKTARNISKGTTIKVPAHKVPMFKPARVLPAHKVPMFKPARVFVESIKQ